MAEGKELLRERTTTIQSNQVIINEEFIISVMLEGIQTVNILEATFQAIDEILEDLRAHKRPKLILLFIAPTLRSDISSRIYGIRWARRAVFDRLAIYSTLSSHVADANWILKIGGLTTRMRVFDDAQSAILWLQS